MRLRQRPLPIHTVNGLVPSPWARARNLGSGARAQPSSPLAQSARRKRISRDTPTHPDNDLSSAQRQLL